MLTKVYIEKNVLEQALVILTEFSGRYVKKNSCLSAASLNFLVYFNKFSLELLGDVSAFKQYILDLIA